jgi:hypothetical protein
MPKRPDTHPLTYIRTHANTHGEMCNTYWFSMATMVSRTRLNVTLITCILSVLFGCKPTFRHDLSVPSSGCKWSKTLMMRPTSHHVTLVYSQKTALCKHPEEPTRLWDTCTVVSSIMLPYLHLFSCYDCSQEWLEWTLQPIQSTKQPVTQSLQAAVQLAVRR